jgi:type I restriction enzyme S subunit
VSEWRSVRLKHLAAEPIRNGVGEPAQFDDPAWPRYIRTTDIAGPRSLRKDTFASLPKELAALAPVRKGDILMSAAGTVGRTLLYLSDEHACYAGYLVRFRPLPTVEPRFVSYWTETSAFLDQIEVGKVTSTIDNFSAGKYRDLRLSCPDLAAQRAVADFLDAETTRIDVLVAKKRRLMELLTARVAALRMETFRGPARWRLKRLLQERTAYGVLVPRFVDPAEGAPMIRINALTLDGRVDRSRLAWIEEKQSLEYQRTIVSPGDLVLSVVGSMGRSAVVDRDASGANLNRPLARLQPLSQLPARLLWHWTQTPQFLDQATLATGGDTAQPTLNLGDLGEFEVGLSDDPDGWHGLLDALERKLAPLHHVDDLLRKQLALLHERRQALITAAVTGQLDIPGLAA